MKFLVSFCLVCTCLYTTAQNKDEAAIRTILTKQVIAWNKGNLDDFMKGYWENDSLMFIGKSGPTYGYAKTLNNYKRGYPDTAHMGKFTSTIINIQKLSPDHYFVTGKWFLQRSIGNLEGYYTLLFRKIDGEWKIIADHSS